MDGLAAAGHAQLTVVVSLIEQLEGRVCAKQPLLQPVEGTAQPGTIAVKRRAEVARRLEFAGQPALVQLVTILGQIPAPFIATSQRHRDGFCRQHPRLHGGVDPLDAGKVEGARITADQQAAREVHAGQGVPAPLGDGAGAIADALPILQHAGDKRVMLEALEFVKRVEPGILVVEIDNQPDRHLIPLHVIEIEATVAIAAPLLAKGPATAVQHLSRFALTCWQLPQLLEADGIVLGLGRACQVEVGDQLLAEMASGPFGKEGVATEQRHAGHMISFRIARPIQPQIAGDDPLDPARFHDKFAGGKSRVYFDSQFFRLLAKPAAEIAQTDHMATLIVHPWRHRPGGELQGALLALQQMHLIVVDRYAERRLLPAIRQQLLQGDGIKQGAGEQMGANFRPFLQQTDRESGILLFQGDGCTEPRRTAADDDDIKFHCFPFHLASALWLA